MEQLKEYAEALCRSIEFYEKLIAKSTEYQELQHRFGITDEQGSREIDDDLARLKAWIERDRSYLKQIEAKLEG